MTDTKKHPNKNTSYISIGSGHPIDADVVIINGVEYKRVEEPKLTTLYDIILEWNDNDDYPTCDTLVDMIEEWLSDEIEYEYGGGDYDKGWNDALCTIKWKLR